MQQACLVIITGPVGGGKVDAQVREPAALAAHIALHLQQWLAHPVGSLVLS